MSPTRMECSFHLASPAAQSCNELWVHMVHGDSHLPCLSAAVMSGSPVFLACMNPAWKSLCPLHSAQSLFLQSEVVPGLSTGDVSHWLPLSGGKHMACFFCFFFPWMQLFTQETLPSADSFSGYCGNDLSCTVRVGCRTDPAHCWAGLSLGGSIVVRADAGVLSSKGLLGPVVLWGHAGSFNSTYRWISDRVFPCKARREGYMTTLFLYTKGIVNG